ncbi:phosphatase PAP2 family protein [Hymenobacter taeanensis]|uniref:Phosphatase PAP2 family protein n=1 Tax=Hymenobacter taeanensis TaxID=2735321 RepID=A0A6M6BI39_9BACT|nr:MULTISPECIES: phosphatase PAP2 family protein [Hymenobacter]QJX47709.1 phosphatase PAP2 family protein [Hymenobacter taeanensis]UOQ82806.1 phosphatase PAP2 family protein [Hymenobacter sp. 5414T-23]
MTKSIRQLLAGVTLFVTEFAITLLLGTVGVVIFLALSREVFDQDAATFDAAAFRWTRQLFGPERQQWVQGITFLASRNFITGMGLLLVAWLLLVRRHRWYSLLVPVVALGSITLNLVLKQFYHRPRPLLPLVSASGLSFPSGHAMISASFYGLMVYLVQAHVRHPALRWGLTTALVALIILIGLTRVYLRVHYATDVLAGFTAGLVWLVVAIPLLQQLEVAAKKRFGKQVQSPEKQPI